MKRTIIIFLLLAAAARADWRDLKEGLDPMTAEQCVGAPLFGNRSRGGTFMNWVYDNGGYILFENGRVRFWQPPVVKGGGVQSLAGASSTARAADHAKASAGSSVPANQAGPGGLTLRW